MSNVPRRMKEHWMSGGNSTAKERIEVHPDEKMELIDALDKSRKRVKRAEKRLRQVYREHRADVVHAYPRLSTKVICETLGITRKGLWEMRQQHEEETTEESTDE